jgi:hypothetical protein
MIQESRGILDEMMHENQRENEYAKLDGNRILENRIHP